MGRGCRVELMLYNTCLPDPPRTIQSNESLIDLVVITAEASKSGRGFWRIGWNHATSIETRFFPAARDRAAGSGRDLVLGDPRDWGTRRDDRGEARARLPTTTVRRADLTASLTAGGRVESSQNTEIECELERMSIGGQGNEFTGGGSSTILSLLAEGTTVRKGDVLCTLDASAYEELLRQQQIVLERAQADHRQAELELDVARLAVGEFQNGMLKQTLQDYQGQIALAKSDLERGADRLEWSKRMLAKGYLSAGQVTNEEYNLARTKLTNVQMQTGLQVYQRFSVPRTLRELKSRVYSAESTLAYQVMRVQLTTGASRENPATDRILHHPRAPRRVPRLWGRRSRMVRIEPGMAVRRKQDLFMLPDLSRMEVLTLLHESVADEVRDGMIAHVRVQGLPDRVLEGHVESVTQLPMTRPMDRHPLFHRARPARCDPQGAPPRDVGRGRDHDLAAAGRPDDPDRGVGRRARPRRLLRPQRRMGWSAAR